MNIPSSRTRVITALILFCIFYPLWIVGVELGMRAAYFNPLCRTHALTHGLEFQTFARGGRSSPPSCVMQGKTVPIRDVGGTTAHALYILTDVVAILLPFFAILLL